MVALYRFLSEAETSLRNADIEDPRFEVDVLLETVTGKHRLQTDEITPEQREQFQAMLLRRCHREPLQYIIESWDFLGLRLSVGPGVLIPRPETEELCLLAAEVLKQEEEPTALDLCAGSGALALGMQLLCENAHITAVELYAEAFSYLQKNCTRFALDHPRAPLPVLFDVHHYHRNLTPGQFSLIVSNPPYLSFSEYARLEKELYHEPKQALLANEDGLAFYRSIAKHYKSALRKGGRLFFEIGAAQGDAVQHILHQNGYRNICLHHDLSHRARIVQAQH